MKTKIIRTEDAVGQIIAHDIARIVQGEFKGNLFKKGHKIDADDVDKLLDVGKYNIYVLSLDDDDVHEDDAGIRLGEAIHGTHTYVKPPSQSRVNIFADCRGMLCLDEEAVYSINDLENSICATIPNGSVVEKDQMVAATKVVPLVVKEEDVDAVESICEASGDVVSVRSFVSKKVGCVITGSEVFSKRIDDAFGPVLSAKINEYGGEIIGMDFAPDDLDQIRDKIIEMRDRGAEVIIATGGMSVDPDDKTPGAIRATGARIVKQGSPVLPGAMFLVAYLENVPVLGVPAAGMYFKNTMFDKMLPYVFADVEIKREDIVKMGVGGLIMNNERYELKK